MILIRRLYHAWPLLALFSLMLIGPLAYAQGVACNGPENAGSSYEACSNGTCEKFVCNGTGFTAAEQWNHDGTRNIDFGYDTHACDIQRLGRIRYGGGLVWEFCNGTAWTGLTNVNATLPLNGTSAVNGRVIGIGGAPQRNFLAYTGIRNTFLGDNAGGGILTGTDNTFLGYNTGSGTTLGSSNIYIGSNTGGLNIASSNNLLIGNNLDAPTLLVSSYLNIANVIWGYMANNGANSSTNDNSASLNIDGTLKIGSSNELCTAGNGGRLRYNATTKKMQFCNETVWTDM